MSGILSGVIKLFFGSKTDKDSKEVIPFINKIKEVYPQIEKLSNDELREKTLTLMAKIADAIEPDEKEMSKLRQDLKNPDLNISQKEDIATKIDTLEKKVIETINNINIDILPEAFAIIKDTARRFTENDKVEVTATQNDKDLAASRDFVSIEGDKALFNTSWTAGGNELNWEMVHYDSQLFGGVVLHTGKIAEMATGEGKTLVSTLPVFLNALSRKGVHVVTVNDYLAKRDSEWMGPIFQFHGLSVDCIDRHSPNSDSRRKAYLADITYGTNNEFGFDYLRDNMANSKDELVQRKHNYAIVDEVDSVLIDDARTPLIISGPVPKGDDQMFEQYNPSIQSIFSLQKNMVTQMLAQAKKLIAEENTDEGGKLLFRAHKALPKYGPLIKFTSEHGIKTLMQKTENIYIAEKNKRMPEITDELYFVIDERMHSADLTDKGHEYMAKNFGDSKFFILPEIGEELAMLSKSTLPEEDVLQRKTEILNDYSIKSERVHTVNQLLKAYALFEKDTAYVVMDNKVKIVDEQTGRIMEGRRYSDGLHQAIEAKEAVNVEAATQTFATVTLQNYFRMYNKLAGMTGTAETESSEFWNIYKLDVVVIPTNRPIVRTDSADLIYKTKREKYAAVIEEIDVLVKAGRPILVGTTSVEISELLSKMLKLRGIPHNVLNAKQHQREAQIIQEAGIKGQVTIATNMAGRGTDIKLSAEVKANGGLAIIGTERHESRRVDRQLRGRAGRQGDPGSSQFFISFEDDLMRLFGSDRVARIVDKMGMKTGENLQSGILNSAIEKAQKKVEENNFGIRKRLLEYDDVMNSQREVIYSRRRNALDGGKIDIDINNMMQDYAAYIIQLSKDCDFEDFKLELIKNIAIDTPFTEEQFSKMSETELADMLAEHIYTVYNQKIEIIAKSAMPVIEAIYKEHGDKVETIGVPFTDGKRLFHTRIDIKKAIESKGYEVYREFSKLMLLISIDENWKQHLRNMDDLRQSSQNASYEQKDPLLIYKLESFKLFSDMVEGINKETISLLINSQIPMRENGEVAKTPAKNKNVTDVAKLQASHRDVANNAGRDTVSKPEPVRVEKKIGRNEQCPCGSGKKYKHCHGA